MTAPTDRNTMETMDYGNEALPIPESVATESARTSRIFGVLVTFRRPEALRSALQRIHDQTFPLTRLIVVDNDTSAGAETVVREAQAVWPDGALVYHAAPENLGPAGGWALGMVELLNQAHADDWIVTLDDNNPPEGPEELATLREFGESLRKSYEPLGAVGIIGARFNWRNGMIQRIGDQELSGAVPVDYLGGGFLPMYAVAALRSAGGFSAPLFFGSVELEMGLRFRRAGYHLVAHGELWKSRRRLWGREAADLRPSKMCTVHWQKYYRIRNYIAMMCRFRRPDLALRWAVIQCVLKPAFSCLRSPRTACLGFVQAVRATRDGFLGRMGRTIEPPAGPPRRY